MKRTLAVLIIVLACWAGIAMYIDDHAAPEPAASATSALRYPFSYTVTPAKLSTPAPVKTPTPTPTVKPAPTAKPTPRPDPTPAPTPMAVMGSRGEDVVQIQSYLIVLNFLHDKADGIYGKLTAQAVRDFQETYNLPVTGEVDPSTYRSMVALYKAYEAKGMLSSGAVRLPSPSPPVRKVVAAATAKPMTAATVKPAPAATTYRDKASKTAKYILNKNTHKFHKPSCSDVKRIAPKNYWEYNGTYNDVVSMGYKPCKHCHPK